MEGGKQGGREVGKEDGRGVRKEGRRKLQGMKFLLTKTLLKKTSTAQFIGWNTCHMCVKTDTTCFVPWLRCRHCT